jgi:hypothetical protein
LQHRICATQYPVRSPEVACRQGQGWPTTPSSNTGNLEQGIVATKIEQYGGYRVCHAAHPELRLDLYRQALIDGSRRQIQHRPAKRQDGE